MKGDRGGGHDGRYSTREGRDRPMTVRCLVREAGFYLNRSGDCVSSKPDIFKHQRVKIGFFKLLLAR